MSEHSPKSPEKFEIPKTPEHKTLPTAEQAERLRPGEPDPERKIERARSNIEAASDKHNKARDALTKAEKPNDSPAATQTMNRNLKKASLRHELKRLQRREKLPARTLSKVIHQPAVRAVSEVTSKSLTRPSGLLGGGLVAFLGTLSYLYFTKHVGVQYNYFIFIALFVGGFIIGIILELVIWLAVSSKRAS